MDLPKFSFTPKPPMPKNTKYHSRDAEKLKKKVQDFYETPVKLTNRIPKFELEDFDEIPNTKIDKKVVTILKETSKELVEDSIITILKKGLSVKSNSHSINISKIFDDGDVEYALHYPSGRIDYTYEKDGTFKEAIDQILRDNYKF